MSAFEQKLKALYGKLHQDYLDSEQQYLNVVVYGDFGTGKTHFISTCPKPLLIHSFDPGGSKIPPLQKLVDEGNCIIDPRFEDRKGNDWEKPAVFKMWEKEMEELSLIHI